MNINHAPIEFPSDRDDILELAFAEGDSCLSVGGLAKEIGLLRTASPSKKKQRKKRGQLKGSS